VKFIAHLVNQRVAHEFLALQILTLLLERPTDDSVEVAVGFMREVGAHLADTSPKANNAIFERFRSILHEGNIDKRTQYMVEVLFQVRKDKFKDNVAIDPELDLVEEEDQITLNLELDDEELQVQDKLNVFQFDEKFAENEQKYEEIKREILGDESEEESEEEEEEAVIVPTESTDIVDKTGRDVVDLRRTIYLTIMSSLNFEESAHKLSKLSIPPGQEIELANMVVECCSQERTYVNFYGLLGERFCKMNRVWTECFVQNFEETYKTIHRYETNRLRNVAKYYAHLLASDALPWSVLSLIHLTEEDTTSSSRIFIKILFQELAEALGLSKLLTKIRDAYLVVTIDTPQGSLTRHVFAGIFPTDNPKDTRFSINFFTSIGLGALTEDMREHLKNAPVKGHSDSESDESLSSRSRSRSRSSSRSRSATPRKRRYTSSPTPPRRRRDSRSVSDSPPRRRRDSRSVSDSPPRRRRDSRSVSDSPPRRRRDSRSVSDSPPRRRRDSRSVSDSPPHRRRDSRSVSDSPPRRRDSRNDSPRQPPQKKYRVSSP
jgi:pre-mRNA-splicing factor CWC22